MRLWYLSHRKPAKAQASLHIPAVSPEPSLFAHVSVEVEERSDQKLDILSPTGWLFMRVWKMSLRGMKSAIISWAGSFQVFRQTVQTRIKLKGQRKLILDCHPDFRTSSPKVNDRSPESNGPRSYMWTLPDHPGASRKCSLTHALPGVRQNLPDVKIQKQKKKKKKFSFFFF